jgi:putative tryptophan/tyrosine transport system substrate-binding protein
MAVSLRQLLGEQQKCMAQQPLLRCAILSVESIRRQWPVKRRDFITLIGGAATWPLAARAQQLDRMRRMGVLIGLGANDPEAQSRAAALEKGLQDAGWIKDRNLRIEYRWADSPDALRTHITELIGMAPDLILASSTPVIVALKEQHARVPIVFVQVTDPLGEGLVASLAHPGGHLTGFTSFEFSIGTKWLELLKQVAPRVRRVALIYNPQTAPFADLFLRPIQAAASSFAIMPVSIGARSFAEIEGTVDAFAREPDGALMVLPDVSAFNYREAVIGLAARHRLPAVYPFRVFVASGGLLSYGTDASDVYRRAAAYIDRILKGERPAELPVQAPTKYEFAINLKTAQALGLDIPPTLLALADEVIE